MKSINTPLREIFSIIKDKQWHEIYEFHQTFNLSAVEIFQAIEILFKKEIIEKNEYSIKICDNLTNSKMAFLNRVHKTSRPQILDFYKPTHLTGNRNRV